VSVTAAQRSDRRRRRRRTDLQLREVLGVRRFDAPADLVDLLPADLPPRFTTADLAAAAGVSRDLAQRVTYCLRALDLVSEVSRTRAGIHYVRAGAPAARNRPASRGGRGLHSGRG